MLVGQAPEIVEIRSGGAARGIGPTHIGVRLGVLLQVRGEGDDIDAGLAQLGVLRDNVLIGRLQTAPFGAVMKKM